MQQKESKTNSHFWISIIKSIIRFGACYFLFNGDFKSSALLFIFAEALGIAEEIETENPVLLGQLFDKLIKEYNLRRDNGKMASE